MKINSQELMALVLKLADLNSTFGPILEMF